MTEIKKSVWQHPQYAWNGFPFTLLHHVLQQNTIIWRTWTLHIPDSFQTSTTKLNHTMCLVSRLHANTVLLIVIQQSVGIRKYNQIFL